MNSLVRSVRDSEATDGWCVPGTFSRTKQFSRENSDTFFYLLKGWKSTKAEASFKCSYMARGTWMDVVFHPQGVHSGPMQKHCLSIIPHVIQGSVTLWQYHLEVGCSSPKHREAGELRRRKNIFFFSFAYIFQELQSTYTYVSCCSSKCIIIISFVCLSH